MEIINPFDLGFVRDIPKNIVAAQSEINQLIAEKATLRRNLNIAIVVSIVAVGGALLYSYNQSITDYEDKHLNQ